MPVIEKDTMEGQGDTGETNEEVSRTEHQEQTGSGTKPRQFLTRASAANRMKAQATLITSIRAMEVDLDPGNYAVHDVLTGQLLDILEKEHNEYVGKEGLYINMEPEKSYINEFKDKLNRARDKHKTRLGILPANKGERMTWISRSWSVTSKTSRGPALLHKMKHNKSKIKAKQKQWREWSSTRTLHQNPRHWLKLEWSGHRWKS